MFSSTEHQKSLCAYNFFNKAIKIILLHNFYTKSSHLEHTPAIVLNKYAMCAFPSSFHRTCINILFSWKSVNFIDSVYGTGSLKKVSDHSKKKVIPVILGSTNAK